MTALQLNNLKKEFAYFNRVKSELRHQHPNGGHALIKDEQVLGVWKTRNEALAAGIEQFGNVVFLVRSIEDEPAHHVNFSFNSIV